MRATAVLLCALSLPLSPLPAAAAGFAALISPPRFEVNARAGGALREVFELTNRAATPAKYKVHTADFTLSADYNVLFHEALLPDSCRPWVAIERGEVTLAAGATMRYRFEVQVPPGTPARECRFAILVEGDEPVVAHGGAVQLPVVGRIGIIVYLRVGDAAPRLELFGPDVVTLNGRRIPALRMHNEGNAHARVSGFLTGTDASGRHYDFTPSDLPILPHEEREVFLTPSQADNDNPTLAFPVTVQGTLQWSDQTTELNERFQ
ncbi:MAG: hypothetical protein JO341_10395 [Gammaproteobacteria bacterium]|nr:hypothetical protein [Gammaproteobacteria bacterium]